MNPDPSPNSAPKHAVTTDRAAPREPHVPTVVQIEHGLVIAAVVLVAVLIAFVAAGGFYLRKVTQDAPKPGASTLTV